MGAPPNKSLLYRLTGRDEVGEDDSRLIGHFKRRMYNVEI